MTDFDEIEHVHPLPGGFIYLRNEPTPCDHQPAFDRIKRVSFCTRCGAEGVLLKDDCPRCEAPAVLPDTGARTNFDTGAVRDAMIGKGLPSQIPVCALVRLAKRFEEGAHKYGLDNWRKGIPLSRFIDALQRHTWAIALGDTTEDHHAAVLWNAAAMMWTEAAITAGLLPKSLDDLPYRPRGGG